MENKFLLTAFIIIIGAVGLIAAIINYFEPNIWLAGIILLLVGIIVDLCFAFFYYRFKPIAGFQTPREHFRKGTRRGLWISLLIPILIYVKSYFLK